MKKLPVDYSRNFYIDDDGDRHTLIGITSSPFCFSVPIQEYVYFIMTESTGENFLFTDTGQEVCGRNSAPIKLRVYKNEE